MPEDQDHLQVTIRVLAPHGKSESLVNAMRSLMGSIRARSGCVSSQVYQDSDNPESISLVQEWENVEKFGQHVGSKEYRHILEWMELSVEQPKVTVCDRINPDGMELIERLRGTPQ